MLIGQNYNPDVLNCLANLSSDEVFTPPKLVNDILDLFPQEIFNDKKTTFLDPVCKTGVFLREIAKRLDVGLESEIPDKQERINHIFSNQLFGIAITELTALLSRRSVYCSKTADGKYSVCDSFDEPEGNIRFERIEHIWQNDRCTFCGTNRENYDRGVDLETHAYQFIHTETPEELFNMKFDVIIGNPPYQLNDGGGMGTSATPLYNRFVEQAKKMKPRFLSMIIPARWYAGGKGLDEFRETMLKDEHITNLIDYFDSTECFPGVDISGGICYFLWERDNKSICKVVNIRKGVANSLKRPILEKGSDVFIRFNDAVSIIRKINIKQETSFEDIMYPRRPFALDSNININKEPIKDYVKVYAYPKDGYIPRNEIKRNKHLVDAHKIMIAKAYGERGDFPYLVLAKPFIGEKTSCCTETYLVIGPFENEIQTKNALSYICTKFFRFLVLLKKNTQNAARGVYSFVPIQDFNENWTEEKLYKKYEIDEKEIEFIDSMIRPMELDHE